MESMDYGKDHRVEIENGDTWYVGLAESNWAEVVVPVNSLEHMTDEEIGATVRKLAIEAEYVVQHMGAAYFLELGAEYMAANRTREMLLSDWTDLARFSNRSEVIRRAMAVVNKALTIRSRMRPGFVYVVRCGPYFKIGRTVAVGPRMATLGIQLPHPLEVVWTASVDDMVAEERFLHEQFSGKRMNGEWFDLSDDDLATIRDWFRQE